MSRLGVLLRRPLRVRLPWPLLEPAADAGTDTSVAVPVDVLRRPAAVIAWVVPVVLMVVGLVVAIVSSVAAERDGTEAAGTLGTELGAALWFAGAVTWGARRRATVARFLLLLLVLVLGLLLIAVAVVRDWTGAGLALAMEFGVGMVAVAVIDVVLLGVVDSLSAFSRGPDGRAVVVRLGQSWHVVDIEVPAGDSSH